MQFMTPGLSEALNFVFNAVALVMNRLRAYEQEYIVVLEFGKGPTLQ